MKGISDLLIRLSLPARGPSVKEHRDNHESECQPVTPGESFGVWPRLWRARNDLSITRRPSGATSWEWPIRCEKRSRTRLYGRRKVLHLRDSRAQTEKEVATAVA